MIGIDREIDRTDLAARILNPQLHRIGAFGQREILERVIARLEAAPLHRPSVDKGFDNARAKHTERLRTARPDFVLRIDLAINPRNAQSHHGRAGLELSCLGLGVTQRPAHHVAHVVIDQSAAGPAKHRIAATGGDIAFAFHHHAVDAQGAIERGGGWNQPGRRACLNQLSGGMNIDIGAESGWLERYLQGIGSRAEAQRARLALLDRNIDGQRQIARIIGQADAFFGEGILVEPPLGIGEGGKPIIDCRIHDRLEQLQQARRVEREHVLRRYCQLDIAEIGLVNSQRDDEAQFPAGRIDALCTLTELDFGKRDRTRLRLFAHLRAVRLQHRRDQPVSGAMEPVDHRLVLKG